MKVNSGLLFVGLRNPHALHFEINRWQTYTGWQYHHLQSPIKLAKAAFHATGNGDEVKCSWCRLTVSGWTCTNKPEIVHKTRSPACPFFAVGGPVTALSNVPVPIVQKDGSNWTRIQRACLEKIVPKGQSIQEADETDIADMEVNRLLFPGVNVRPYPRRRRRRNNENLRLAGLLRAADGDVPYTAQMETATDGPLFPIYSTNYNRRRTYYGFPQEKECLIEDMIKSGLFYTGLLDVVTCHFCGLTLEDWAVGQDDPRLAHARWSPICFYLVSTNVSQLPVFAQRELQVIGQ